MAEHEPERTEQPTPKRLEEARKQGQVPRSVELSTAAVLLTAGGGLNFLGRHMGGQLDGMLSSALTLSREQSLDETFMIASLSRDMLQALVACAPILGLTLIAALSAPMLLGGWNLSFSALAPDFNRLNPMEGFGRMFSARGAVELGKA